MKTYEDYLASRAVDKDVIDLFLDGNQSSYMQFDSELGYTVGNALFPDGMDNSLAITTTQENGARTSMIYHDRPCRINTYGNSFTQCTQASDGETWQEYLASHLGEPVRNFGVGGFGVYQAYRRLLRTEQSEDGAEYVILYIWGDDHCRSLMRCRHAAMPGSDLMGGFAFSGNFWCNLELDIDSSCFIEKDSPLTTPESLYHMTDPEYMVESLRDDLMLQMYAITFGKVNPESIDIVRLNALADLLNVARIDINTMDTISDLINAYGFSATKYILDNAERFCLERGKKLLICLMHPMVTKQLLRKEERYDQEMVDYIQKQGLLCFDMNISHQKDYECFNDTVGEKSGFFSSRRAHSAEVPSRGVERRRNGSRRIRCRFDTGNHRSEGVAGANH